MQVSVAEAKARLSELLAAVHHRGERVLISRHGKPYAWILSTEELERLEGERDEVGRRGVLALGDLSDLLADDEWDAFERFVAEARENSIPSPPVDFDALGPPER